MGSRQSAFRNQSKIAVGLICLAFSLQAHAWGKRGHMMVSETAAYVLKDELPFLKGHSFDLGYYANVPDILWKRPETNKFERSEHYVDMEIISRAMGEKANWDSDRRKFFKSYPEAKKAGFAFWRIEELCQELKKTEASLHQQTTKKNHQIEQVKWLSLAGVVSHYAGDLSQPLHTTENNDGQFTAQKGIHSYYETEIVNELYPEIAPLVLNSAKLIYRELKGRKSNSCFDLSKELAQISHTEVKKLLTRNSTDDRKNIANSASLNKEYIVSQLARGAAFVAVIWSKYASWDYQGQNFFGFDEKPNFIKPVSKDKL